MVMKFAGKKMRKIISLAISAALIFALTIQTGAPTFAAESGKTWPSFRGDPVSKGISDSVTPRTAKQTAKNWSVNLDPGSTNAPATNPVIYNGKIYIATALGDPAFGPSTAGKITAYNSSGKKVMEKAFPSTVGISYSSSLAYGDGKIFVPVFDSKTKEARVIAFSASNLKQLWTSASLPADYEIVSSLVYRSGYIYGGSSFGWDASSTQGCFFALSAKDADTSRSDETVPFKWTYTSAKAAKGYYMAGCVFTKKAVFFAGDDGTLVSHSLTSNQAPIATYAMNGPVRSDLYIKNNVIYATTQAGSLYRIPVSDSGKISASKVKKVALPGKASTSSPVVYGKKVYVVSGQSSFVLGEAKGKGYLNAYNASTLKKLSQVALGEFSQSSLLLSSGYASKTTKNTVNLYVLLNADKDNVICVEDNDSLKTPKKRTLYTPGGSFTATSLLADNKGNLYFVHSITTNPVTYATSSELVSIGTKKATVKFNVNGGKKLKTASKKAVYGNRIGSLPKPSYKNSGKVFAGWYTKKKGGVRVTENTIIKSTKARTYYARWRNK